LDINFFHKRVNILRLYGVKFTKGQILESGTEGTFIQVNPNDSGAPFSPNMAMVVEGLNIGYYPGTDDTFNYLGREQIRAIYPEHELDEILKTITTNYLNSDKEVLGEHYAELTHEMRSREFHNDIPQLVYTLIMTGFLDNLKRTWKFDGFTVAVSKEFDSIIVHNTSLNEDVFKVHIDLTKPVNDVVTWSIFHTSMSPELMRGIFIRLTRQYVDFLITSGLITSEPMQWDWVDMLNGTRQLNRTWLAWRLFHNNDKNLHLTQSGMTVANTTYREIAGQIAAESSLPVANCRVQILDTFRLKFQIFETKEVVVF
jgi:hypothetical protein